MSRGDVYCSSEPSTSSAFCDPSLQRLDQGALGAFNEVVERSPRKHSRFYAFLKQAFGGSQEDILSKMHQVKCDELYRRRGNRDRVSEKVSVMLVTSKASSDPLAPKADQEDVSQPLGRKVKKWKGAEFHTQDCDDPLIRELNNRTRSEAMSRHSERKRRVRQLTEDYQFTDMMARHDDDDDPGKEEPVPSSLETPDRWCHELGETRCCLEFATRKYWKVRDYLTKEDLVWVRFRLLASSAWQLAGSCALFCLAALQLEGGDKLLVITGCLSAAVGAVASFLLCLSALTETPFDEKWTFFCYITEIWLCFLLVSFLLADASYIHEVEKQCVPSVQTYTAKDPCSERPEIYVTLVVGVFNLFGACVATFSTIEVLDRSNRRASLTDKFLLFKYRHALLRELQAASMHSESTQWLPLSSGGAASGAATTEHEMSTRVGAATTEYSEAFPVTSTAGSPSGAASRADAALHCRV